MPAVQLHDLLDHIQAHADAAHLVAGRILCAVEARKDLIQRLGRDAQATVLHAQPGVSAVDVEQQPDRPAVWAVLYGVLEQILHHLLQPQVIADHTDRLALDRDLKLVALCEGQLQLLADPAHQRAKIHLLALDAQLADLEARQI